MLKHTTGSGLHSRALPRSNPGEEASKPGAYLDDKTRRRLGWALRNLYKDLLLLPPPQRLADLQDRLSCARFIDIDSAAGAERVSWRRVSASGLDVNECKARESKLPPHAVMREEGGSRPFANSARAQRSAGNNSSK